MWSGRTPAARVNNNRIWLILVAVLAIGLLLYRLGPILTPFVLSLLFAYLANPVVRRFQAWHVPRAITILCLFIVIAVALLTLILVLVPLIRHQIEILVTSFPAYVDWLQQHLVRWTGGRVPIEFEALRNQLLQQWQNIGRWAASALTFATNSGLRVFGWVLNAVLVPVITFYLLRDWDGIIGRIAGALPPRVRLRLAPIAQETNEALAGFLRGQLFVMLTEAVFYSAGLWLIGLDLALLIGIVAGLISFIPYLGFFLGILFATLAAALQIGDWTHVLWVWALFALGQTLESSLLTPRLVGERIGLHPVVVFFAVMAGGQLFGFLGILLALPVTAMVWVWLRHLYRLYQDRPWFAGSP